MNQAGADVVTIVNDNEWGDLSCEEIKYHESPAGVEVEGVNATMLMKKTG